MAEPEGRKKIFISHSSVDTWVAKQIAAHIEACGFDTFLDAVDIRVGDDFEEEIKRAAKLCSEILVLLTPWAMNRRYVWMEIGLFGLTGRRIVSVTYGVPQKKLLTSADTPLSIKRSKLLDINDIDAYFGELKGRASGGHTIDA